VFQTPQEGSPWWLRIEFNPARVGDPHGHELVDPDLVADRFDGVRVACERLAYSDLDSGEATVTRLDAARDFVGVRDTDAFLRAHGSTHRPYSRKNHLMSNGNGTQTLVVGSRKAGNLRAYDKHVETEGAVPPGTLRVETEARKNGWLAQYSSITGLATVNATTVTELARDRFQWAGLDREVAGAPELFARLATLDVAADTRRAYVGWLVEQSAGLASPISKATLAKYRRISRDLGIATGPDLLSASVTSRLDWESGTVVLRAA
jgi:hypothetical protein